MRCLRSIFVALLLISATAFGVKAAPTVPPLTGAVMDLANLLPASSEKELTGKLQGVRARTGVQIVVVTLPALGQYPIETWGITLGRGWKIGRAGKDDGILIIVAPNDREVRIEVGYGLEGDIPDARAHRIINDILLPAFRSGNFGRGIGASVDALERLIVNPDTAFPPQGTHKGLYIVVALVAGIILMLLLAFRAFPLGADLASAADDDDRSDRSDLTDDEPTWRSSSSDSSSSSDHSSFSGGGGSFGGGGASGKW